MLSHEDERRLAAIERRMLDDDPDFVRRFRRRATAMPASSTPGVLVTVLLCAMGTVGSLVVLAGLLAPSVGLLASGGAVTALAWWAFRRARRHPG